MVTRMTFAPLLVLVCLAWPTGAVDDGSYFGVYKDTDSGNMMYTNPIPCTVTGSLYSAIDSRASNNKHQKYTERTRDTTCCFLASSRNDCCLEHKLVPGGKVQKTCKCSTSQVCGLCPEGWIYYPAEHTCLKLMTSLERFSIANSNCRPGQLVKITSADFQQFVTTNLLSPTTNDVWLGVLYSGGAFRLLSQPGQQLPFKAWGTGQPQYTAWNQKKCVVMNSRESFRWSTNSCSGLALGLCQQAALK